MDRVDFGAGKPEVTPFHGGYRVPVGLQCTPAADGQPENWEGYWIEVPALIPQELDQALAALPPGDYSADRLAALAYAARQARRREYPPLEDYIDGVVKGDEAQVAAYKAKCLAVKKRFPIPGP